MHQGAVVWRKSTHSGNAETACVEVAGAAAHILARDSKRPGGPRLSFTASAWNAFLIRGVSTQRI